MFIHLKESSVLHYFALLFVCSQCLIVSSTILAGVTIKSPPFINTENNRFSGLCVDLMNEIHVRTGINYSLYLVEDGLYGPGRMANGKMTGMIADVHKKKADFAIGDLTATAFRERFVNFTEPFFAFSISALVQRTYAKNLKTLDDLAIKSNLTVGAFAGSNTLVTLQRLRKENVRTIRWLYNRIVQNETNLVTTREEALFKVHNEEYAFVQEEPKNMYQASKDCTLTVLRDPNYYFYGRYAIAFRPDSPFLKVFSRTIKQLEREGFLDKLKDKYFNTGCFRNSGNTQTRVTIDNLALVLVSILLCAYRTLTTA